MNKIVFERTVCFEVPHAAEQRINMSYAILNALYCLEAEIIAHGDGGTELDIKIIESELGLILAGVRRNVISGVLKAAIDSVESQVAAMKARRARRQDSAVRASANLSKWSGN